MTKETIERLFDKRARTQDDVQASIRAATRAARAIEDASTSKEVIEAMNIALRLVRVLASDKIQNITAEREFIEARDGN
jgi:hypothetical protein